MNSKPIFSSKVYDSLKWVAMVALPAVATFYYALALVWGLPYAGEIVATITATDTLLGALLGISSAKYRYSDARFDGDLNIIKSDPSLINQLDIRTDPATLGSQKEVVLKVNKVDIEIPEGLDTSS